ncbi:hypothetical protein Srubr_39090 [Streptomyces rubradiris]|uniref:Uncharacterized protein n=1 Tax=Streptomyces rubradiris TaxID=285531 RepID=A0ABQ3RDY4_STRRR|nr:hypothetical protein GCM10018792_71610 [Streptomyces rubradiris]GHI54063.1 hypothetical protein Srubr_39090 [Streptomyces rubradiris]
MRRVAQRNGLRLIRESDGDQQTTRLTEASVQQTRDAVVNEPGALDGAALLGDPPFDLPGPAARDRAGRVQQRVRRSPLGKSGERQG